MDVGTGESLNIIRTSEFTYSYKHGIRFLFHNINFFYVFNFSLGVVLIFPSTLFE
jgi:hypothetical protein